MAITENFRFISGLPSTFASENKQFDILKLIYMDRKIKRIFIALLLIVTSAFDAMADKDVPISVNELPTEAQKILSVNFPNKKVALSKKEVDFFGRSYDVILTNGDKIEFDANGRWEKISCKHESVPVALIPSFIYQYVKEHFPEERIVKIEREKRGFEVELSNDIDLKFDKKGRCIEID